ncbi:hypothetical protein KR044_005349, partial [Drosophila immigrans]
MESEYIYISYKKARRKFSLKTYFLLLAWLALALTQWLIVVLIQDVRDVFQEHYNISIVAFVLAILLFGLFLFIESLRYSTLLALVTSFLIVELQIVALFTLVARTYWSEMLMYFIVCVVVVAIFVLIGLFLPRRMDFTLHIALIFILAFLLLLIAIYFLMHQLLVSAMGRDIHGFLVVQLPISIIILFVSTFHSCCTHFTHFEFKAQFVMYHAQTINGERFAEMRLHDYYLGSLILFHDFLIIYWLTFYWQLTSGVVTPEDWTQLSTPWNREMQKFSVDLDDFTESILSNNNAR